MSLWTAQHYANTEGSTQHHRSLLQRPQAPCDSATKPAKCSYGWRLEGIVASETWPKASPLSPPKDSFPSTTSTLQLLQNTFLSKRHAAVGQANLPSQCHVAQHSKESCSYLASAEGSKVCLVHFYPEKKITAPQYGMQQGMHNWLPIQKQMVCEICF